MTDNRTLRDHLADVINEPEEIPLPKEEPF